MICPCPIGGGSKKLVELSPFRDAGSGSDDDPPQPATLKDKAKSWLEMATKPISSFRESQEKAAAQAERAGVLKAGATMKILPDGRGEVPKDVRVSLTQDGSMITWSGSGGSGVMALSAVRDIKVVLQTGFFSNGKEIPRQWMCVADDQSARFEAASEEEKLLWMDALAELASQQSEAKSGRKLAYQAKRQMGLEAKKREAERRKAEVMKTCGSGGMKHTAAAMMNRA